MTQPVHKFSNSLLDAAFAALPDPACIIEPMPKSCDGPCDWRFLVSNNALCRLLGAKNVIGQSVSERFPEVAERWLSEFDRVLAGDEPTALIDENARNSSVYEIILTPLSYNGGRRALLARIRDISAERTARTRRREADARYKRLFDAIDEGFCIIELIFDSDGYATDYSFVEANTAFVDQSGLNDPVGRSMRSFEPDIEDKWPETYGRIARSGVAERFESESSVMGRWFDVFAFPIGEEPPFLVGILFEDVGERKRMELALRHSESRLQSLIEATSDLIFHMNPDATHMQQVGGKPLLGAYGVAGNWVETVIPKPDRAAIYQELTKSIQQRKPLELEHRICLPDGVIGWLSTRAVPVLDDAGAITEWFGMATDVTQRHHAEEQLFHGAQMLRMASEIGKVGIWDWEVETGKIVWSDEHFRMHGYNVGEIVPTYEIWAERVFPEDRPIAESKITQAMERGEEYINEYRVLHSDGEVRWLSARGSFLYDENSQPVRMLGAMIDTTARRREEEWQKLLVAELQHRVRNLIGMVRSVARLSAPSHRNVTDYVDHLIGRLQAMGRTQSTLTRLPGCSVDLSELVNEELLAHAAYPNQYHVAGPAVPLSPHAAEIVTLAIHELATNSIKYGALGDTGYIRISWTTSQDDSQTWVSLRWQETAPVRQSKPNRKGFGRMLIEERVPYELKGKGQLTVHDTGVLAELEFPLSNSDSIFETRP